MQKTLLSRIVIQSSHFYSFVYYKKCWICLNLLNLKTIQLMACVLFTLFWIKLQNKSGFASIDSDLISLFVFESQTIFNVDSSHIVNYLRWLTSFSYWIETSLTWISRIAFIPCQHIQKNYNSFQLYTNTTTQKILELKFSWWFHLN